MSITTPDLSSEVKDVVDRMLRHGLSICDFVEHLEITYTFSFTSLGTGSLVIQGQCDDPESLESLWKDCNSGVLNEAAERFLVTDDIKRKINLETVKLKTIIKEDNYLRCKKALTGNSGTLGR